MDSRVSLTRCRGYEEVEKSVHDALGLLGGIENFIQPGDNVVIKPNLVAKKKPKEAVTTNPAFLHAVIQEVEAAGGRVTIAESPGGAYHASLLKGLYAGCGIDKAIEGTNAVLNYDTSFSEVAFEEGHTIKNFPIIQPILDADVIISLPKLKTHAMTSYTGAVKNLFGVIPGTYKAEYHFRLNDRAPFCSMLVDLCECVKPTLSIMDGVWGMEGNGPTAGKNRFIGLVLASANSHALDLVACDLIGYAPDEVDTVKLAVNRGLCPAAVEDITVLGESVDDCRMKEFLKPETHFDLLKVVPLPAALKAKLTDMLRAKPAVQYEDCIGCGQCMRCCPPGAITMREKGPVIDMKQCIRCFCCHELCPEKAVEIKRPLLAKGMLKFLK